jgi:hypothetical protein
MAGQAKYAKAAFFLILGKLQGQEITMPFGRRKS